MGSTHYIVVPGPEVITIRGLGPFFYFQFEIYADPLRTGSRDNRPRPTMYKFNSLSSKKGGKLDVYATATLQNPTPPCDQEKATVPVVGLCGLEK